MKAKIGFIIALAVLLFSATPLLVGSVSADGAGLLGRYWQDTFFGAYLPPYPGCMSYDMPPPGPYPQPTMTRIDATINFKGTPPPEFNWRPFGNHEFSVKWTGHVVVPEDGTYWFRLHCDDGGWLYIDGTLVINHGGTHAPTTKDGSIDLMAGSHDIVIDFYETCDVECGMVFSWKPPGATDWAIVPSEVLVPAPLPNPAGSVPEFGLAMSVVTSLAAAIYLAIKKRMGKTLE